MKIAAAAAFLASFASANASDNPNSKNKVRGNSASTTCPAKGNACNGHAYYKIMRADELDVSSGGLGGKIALLKRRLSDEDVWGGNPYIAGDTLFGSTTVPVTFFLEHAPENCVLAGVHSEAEWHELFAEANARNTIGLDEDGEPTGGAVNLYLGMTKSIYQVSVDGGDTNPTTKGSRQNWLNLDGTPAAVTNPDFWDGPTDLCPSKDLEPIQCIQPDNYSGLEEDNGDADNWLFMFYEEPAGVPQTPVAGRLGDINADIAKAGINLLPVYAAMYQCCAATVTFPQCH